MLNDGNVPERYAAPVHAAAKAHRLFAALDDAGRNDLVGDVYAAIGARAHDGGEGLADDLVREAATGAGAGEWLPALDDERWDATVELSTKAAVELAGPDVGSPVLAHGSPTRRHLRPDRQPGPPRRGGRPPARPGAGDVRDRRLLRAQARPHGRSPAPRSPASA